jgi:hypothetical protein
MADLTGVCSRREILRAGAVASFGAMLLTSRPESLFAAAPRKSKVVLIRDKDALTPEGQARVEVVQAMLDSAVVELTGARQAAAAWGRLVRATDVVGLKSNVWEHLPTPAAVEQAIERRVLEVGVRRSDLASDDRGVRRNGVFARATALINARPMRTHFWSGVGSLIKNYIMFAERPPDYHPDGCADLGALWHLPQVKGKTRLNVLVLLTPQFHGVGPHAFSREYVWSYYGLAVGTDPVAVDSVGLKIIEAKRREHFREDRPLTPPARHIALADTRHGLGTADPAKIEVVRLGYDQDPLVSF